MDVELKYLATFAAVCEEGGFNKASRKLHLTQPAVSYQIRMLEQQMGVRLFERMGRSLIITPEGKALRAYCRRFLSEFAEIRSQFARNDVRRAEPIRIASVSGFGRYVLFPLLCRDHYKHLRIDLRYPPQVEVLRMVESGECDLGIVYDTKVSNFLQFEPVYTEHLVLVASATRAVRRLDFKQLKTYERLPMITYEESDYVFGRWFETLFKRQPASNTSVHHFEELEETIEMVTRGLGFSILPDHSVAPKVRSKQLRVITPFLNKTCRNTIFAVTRSGALLRDEVRRIIRELQQQAAE